MKETKELLLTTSQAAALFQVHESSIKRWANDGKLSVQKTKGGHRRIEIKSLLDWVRVHQPSNPLCKFGNDSENIARSALDIREMNQWEPFRDLLLEGAKSYGAGYVKNAMNFMVQGMNIPLTRLLDFGLGSAIKKVGTDWEEGEMGIAFEHFWTQQFLDAMHRFRTEMLIDKESDSKKTPRAIVGCAQGCQHELGAMMCRLVLENKGWEVIYLGQDLPYEEFIQFQKEFSAQMLCISFVPPLGINDIKRCLRVFSALYQSTKPFGLVLGGGTVNNWKISPETVHSFRFVRSYATLQSFEHFLESLNGSPKDQAAEIKHQKELLV